MNLRRLRQKESLRGLVAETSIRPENLVQPVFAVNGRGIIKKIESMPQVFRYSPDKLPKEVEEIQKSGVGAVLIFGVPQERDETGRVATSGRNPTVAAIKILRKKFPQLAIIADVCLCSYTKHGHCGILKKVEHNVPVFDEKKTLRTLAEVAQIYAEAGADIVAPSAMMDHQVGAIRSNLDKNGLNEVAIMSYSAKYASGFYGPFREAAESSPRFGDRRGYQLPPPNIREALREIETDISEGADIVMVKPALSYLDVIAAARSKFYHPIAAFNVSGEYSMVKAAAGRGWLDEKRCAQEILLSIRRAGADIIITYWARNFARWLEEENLL